MKTLAVRPVSANLGHCPDERLERISTPEKQPYLKPARDQGQHLSLCDVDTRLKSSTVNWLLYVALPSRR
ncbi:unnamed protein product [Camellia sinensis]